MPYVEDFAEFKVRAMAKDNPLREPIYTGGRWLLWSGGQSDGKFQHIDPPDDELELRALRAEYLQARLEEFKQRYRRIYAAVATQAEFVASSGAVSYEACVRVSTPDDVMPDWQEQLKSLAERIESTKAELLAVIGDRPKARRNAIQERSHYLSSQREAARNTQRKLSEMPNY